MLSAVCRIIGMCLVLSLPSLAQAQTNQADPATCLSDKHSRTRISGKVVYISFKHPARDITIWGYKIVLLQPRCDDIETVADRKTGALIDEVTLLPFSERRLHDGKNEFFKSSDYEKQWQELDRYLKPRIGKLVTVTGEMQENLTIYYVAAPQIVINSLALCEIAPKTKGIEKC